MENMMGLFRWVALISAIVFVVAFTGAIISSQQSLYPITQQTAGDTNPCHSQRNDQGALWDRWFPDSNTVFTFILAVCTIALASAGVIQLNLLRRAEYIAATTAQAAKDAADATKASLIASQRAWVRIDEIALGGGGLAFDKNGGSVAVSFKITNVGNTPAINVTPYAWLIVLKNGGPFALSEQQRKCAEIRNQPPRGGFTVFPAETFPANMGINQWSLGTNISRAELEQGLATSSDGKHVAMQVYGVIDYTFATDPNGHHQTGFVFDLRKNTASLISPDEGIIPINQLHLMPSGIGIGQFAD